MQILINPLSANLTKWSNTLKQFVGKLSVFDHFVGLALKGLTSLVTGPVFLQRKLKTDLTNTDFHF